MASDGGCRFLHFHLIDETETESKQQTQQRIGFPQMSDLTSIYHETQEGLLCAQHALNSLLQGPYFTAVDLASLAADLDNQEARALAEGSTEGTDSKDYQNFLKEKEAGHGSNYDDSGYFSVQVILNALAIWNLELLPYLSQAAASIRSNPTSPVAYICNLQSHWFTLRKFGGKRWYNLNSLYKRPTFVSDTYLALLLQQLMKEGYSVFVVQGEVPRSEADELAEVLDSVPPQEFIVPAEEIRVDNRRGNTKKGYVEDDGGDDDAALQAALKASLNEEVEEDNVLKQVMEASWKEFASSNSYSARAGAGNSSSSGSATAANTADHDAEEELQKAIAMSLEGSQSPRSSDKRKQEEVSTQQPPDLDEVRRKRLARFV